MASGEEALLLRSSSLLLSESFPCLCKQAFPVVKCMQICIHAYGIQRLGVDGFVWRRMPRAESERFEPRLVYGESNDGPRISENLSIWASMRFGDRGSRTTCKD